MSLLAETFGHLADLAAAATPAPGLKPDDDKVNPGWIPLVGLIVMGILVAFGYRSMRRRIGNIDVDRHRREQEAKAAADPNASSSPIGDDGVETGNP